DICVLVDQTGSDIVAFENLSDRYRAPTIGNPAIGADAVIPHGGFNQRLGRRGPVDVDRACALVVPRDRPQRTKPWSVIVMVMGNEDRADVADDNTGFCNTSRYSVPSIDNVVHSVDCQ